MPVTDDAPAFERQGFLKEDFRLFHLKDKVSPCYEFHYHDFLKIMVLLEGRVNYVIEGRSYILHPFDIVLVGRGQIHRPEVEPGQPYERQILYLSQDFLDRHRENGDSLDRCFATAAYRHSNVLRLKDEVRAAAGTLPELAAGRICRVPHEPPFMPGISGGAEQGLHGR